MIRSFRKVYRTLRNMDKSLAALVESSTTSNRILRRQNKLLTLQNKELEKVVWELSTVRRVQWRALIHASTRDVIDDVTADMGQRQLGFVDTVNLLRDSGLSFVRYGDGELRFMMRLEHNQGFQKNSESLAAALRETLSSIDESTTLLGMPFIFHDMHWSGVWPDVWGELKPLIARFDRLGVAHATRPIFFQVAGDAGVAAWRAVWSGKTVTVVTGEDSRFTLVPELFDEVQQVKWVTSTPTEAYSDIPRLLDELENDSSDIVLVALGPAGTVLSGKLAARGQRVIDVGHISDSYENIYKNAAYPESKALTKKAE